MATDSTAEFLSRSTQLRVFFAVDLCGVVKLKERWSSEHHAPPEDWPSRFEKFFAAFDGRFRAGVAQAREEDDSGGVLAPSPQLWRTEDASLSYTELVYPGAERNLALKTSVEAFVDLVVDLDKECQRDGVGVRGWIWTAGFPIRNKRVEMIQDVARDRDPLPTAEEMDSDTRGQQAGPVAITSYLGRDMDLGRRLGEATPEGRVVVSIDLARFLVDLPRSFPLSIWLTGWRSFEGVFNGMRYPMLLLERGSTPRRRDPWEPDGPDIAPEVVQLLAPGHKPLNKTKLLSIADDMVARHPHVIVPYASHIDMPLDHQVALKEAILKRNPRTFIKVGGGVRHTMLAGQVPAITLDELTSLLFKLQENNARIAPLREVLHTIAAHEEYGAWLEGQQFASELFRLVPELSFDDDVRRRLAEELFLVHDDALRVKLNVSGDQLFLTDGLWISPRFRAFSFLDESDLIFEECEKRDLLSWASCVIDPATGAGHHPLRYPPGDVRAYGFDRNPRALVLAAINALLNDRTDVRFGINDIRARLPATLVQREERVLMLANMPFAPSPKANAISRSADGGKMGYERTLDALDAFAALAEYAAPTTELRAVVLIYTIGNKADDRWHLVDYAYDKFGEANVSWTLRDDQKLWRVNGKKEQVNPMPLTKLALKASCQFHVREGEDRDEMRQDYDDLALELKDKGYDHLAYGLLTIVHPEHGGVPR